MAELTAQPKGSPPAAEEVLQAAETPEAETAARHLLGLGARCGRRGE
jgi:hypothetical protein